MVPTLKKKDFFNKKNSKHKNLVISLQNNGILY